MENKAIVLQSDQIVSEIEFELPHSVTYGVAGGNFWTATGIMAIQESKNGEVVLHKSDGTFTKIAKGWLSYDVVSPTIEV